MNIEETLRLHALWAVGDSDGVQANLQGANLQGASLCGVCLRGANLQGANLREAYLCQADLRGANLCEADLCEANLCEANLREANLREADLNEANLRRADLREANLRSADLSEANLREAVGNAREIVSLHFDTWAVSMTKGVIAIGCQQHSVEFWRKASDETISAMDSRALGWWGKWKHVVLGVYDNKFGELK